MRTSQYSTAALIDLFRQQTVATLAEVMTALGTGARRTAFRKLKEIPYRASYSHRGRYYTLDELIDGPEQQKSPPKSAFVLAPALMDTDARASPLSTATCSGAHSVRRVPHGAHGAHGGVGLPDRAGTG